MPTYRFPEKMRPEESHLQSGSTIPAAWGGGNQTPTIDHLILHDVTKSLLRAQCNSAQILSINVINYTDVPIVCLDRNNNVLTILPQTEQIYNPHYGYNQLNDNYLRFKGSIVVEMVQTRNVRGVNVDDAMYQKYKRLHELQYNEVGRYHYSDINDYDTVKRDCSNQIHQYVINDAIKVLERHNDAMYLEACNVVFMLSDCPDLIIHPETPESVLLAMDKTVVDERDSVTHQMYIVDSDGLYTNCFANLSGSVTKVPVRRDTREPPGIYLKRSHRVGRAQKVVDTEFYKLDDPNCPIRIFSSYQEAQAYGDPEKMVELKQLYAKLSLAEQSVKQAQKQLEIQETKHKHEMEGLLKKKELDDKSHAQKMAQMDKEISTVSVKQQVETEKYRRDEKASKFNFFTRMTFDGVKLATVTVTLISTALVWLAKRRTA